ncbi:unnamed protein product [Hapterophycus canaliculatus]
MFLKRRVIERAREQPLPSVRGLWCLLWPRTYRDAVGKIGPREFQKGMAEFEVPVTQREAWVVTTAFNADNSGQICMDKLMHFFRAGGLCEGRRSMVQNLFRKLDSADQGGVRLGRIREACDFSSSPAVTKGKARQEELTETFLQHLHTYKERFDAEAFVNMEQFQEAFLDIGTACIKLDSCVWTDTDPPPISSSEGLDLDLYHDRNEAQGLFIGVVSSIG